MFLVFMFNQFLKSHERERFNVMFNEIDTDHDGSITSDEISACKPQRFITMSLNRLYNRP